MSVSINLTKTNESAIRADLLHLLLTNKGERLYMPDFGSDLKKFIFEPNDGITHIDIKNNINETIKKYIPNLSNANSNKYNNESRQIQNKKHETKITFYFVRIIFLLYRYKYCKGSRI